MQRFSRFFPRRLDVQLALVCTIVLASTMPWFIVYEANKDLDNFLENVEKQTKVLAENIAVTSVEHIVTNDFISIEKLLLRSVLFPGIIDIQVINNKGQILSDVFKNSNDKPETRFSKKNTLNLPETEQALTLFTENTIVVWAPVKSGTILGWVKLNYSLLNANEHNQERILDYMKDVSIITIALILLLLLAMRRPLSMISAAADFAGNLDEKNGTQIPMQRQSKELDKLFLALNKASKNLSEQDSTIKTIVKDLETQKHALDEHSIVSIADTNGLITYANDKLLSSTGYKINELIGKSHKVMSSHTHSNDFYSDLWDTIKEGKVWHGDIVNKRKSGEKIWMQTTIVPFLNTKGVPHEYVAIQTDITSQKITESLLAEKNESLKDLTELLESKVKSRTAELLKANEELMKLNTVKSNFISIVSHELRTPLTSIKSFSEILEDDFEDLDTDTRRHYLSIINKESVRLGNLINDVLDLQKIDSGKMTWNKEKTDLRKLASSTVELFSKSYANKDLELRTKLGADECIALVDSDKIKQVLTNLLSNAYKFTDQGSVTLELKKITQKPKALIIDDDKLFILFLEHLLDEMGVETIFCRTAEQAIPILNESRNNVNLIIADIILPDMTGAELIKTIREFTEDTPIIITSKEADNDNLKLLFSYNVMAFIEKSLDAEKLTLSIEKIFGQMQYNEITDEMLEISIIDTGLGIADNDLDKVFEQFQQIDNSETREKGGSGLGLCICKDIVEHHGGKLWVTSKLGEGSRFTFNLPLLVNTKSIAQDRLNQ